MGAVRYSFDGESVLVTGASRGIGFAVAKAFAVAGADVTILSSGAGIHAAASAIAAETGRPCAALECDITNSAFYVPRHAVPKMADGGRILITASIWSRVAVPEFSAYVTSKHANLGFMRVMAKELGPRGIRVNAVCPGWVRMP